MQCFRHYFARNNCACTGHRYLTRNEVLQQATQGGADCPVCGERSDLREALRHFNVLGQLEGLFGLEIYTLQKDIPATQHGQLNLLDLALDIPYEASLVFANITPQAADFDEAPWLLAPQDSHKEWGLQMRVYVPPGPKRAISLMVAVRPRGDLEPGRELALQAADAFHRWRHGLAAVLLGASVEAILRPLALSVYKKRGVKMPENLAYGALIERARLLFEPSLGPQLIGHLRELSKDGRNPSAHGKNPGSSGNASLLEHEKVATWMVDVATLYEWARVATPIGE
jgi:hypothetical protein